jgi:hypothetical protein
VAPDHNCVVGNVVLDNASAGIVTDGSGCGNRYAGNELTDL